MIDQFQLGSIIGIEMMSKRQIRVAEINEKVNSQYPPEQKPIREPAPGPVQAMTPQAAYGCAQINRDGSRPVDLLALQRAVGNHVMQRIVAQHVDCTTNQQHLQRQVEEHRLEKSVFDAKVQTKRPAQIAPSTDLQLQQEASGFGIPTIQRIIIFHDRQGAPGAPITEDTIDDSRVVGLVNNLIRGPLRDIVDPTNRNFFMSARYRRNLIVQIVTQMHRNSQRFYFLGESELANEVRNRALVSIYVRQSQGSRLGTKAFDYPDRRATRGCDPRVNLAARRYWGPVQEPNGDYYFNLSTDGLEHPYQALVTLFTEQSRPCDRTLIHCDYLVSVIQYRAMAETMGTARFEQEVQSRRLPMVLKWDGFSDITSPNPSGATTASFRRHAFQEIVVASPAEFMLGDHVVMFNHESYDSLNEVKLDPWRLENAVITKVERGANYFQGHGYFSPLPLNHFINSMMSWYNRKVDDALGYIRATNMAALHAQFPNIVLEGGRWVIRYQKLGGDCGDTAWHTRPLRRVTQADFANPFANPCSGQISVRRPIESVRNVR